MCERTGPVNNDIDVGLKLFFWGPKLWQELFDLHINFVCWGHVGLGAAGAELHGVLPIFPLHA